ncbi:hypothetical protein AGABI1DRAFT_114884 [Agaricus bisporus var. burnettii JB137-S8]|nr:hypothetical protein AGABI2DRAFT_191110 [Agaricus bisporus var. bisporus H97]XP_007331399.1 uncharacterized protein AGABI1DRAFT_114884 [Agaricus bisporus var. burnettii JB137-S8]EKM78049.1 hypothetical protein AGABI1DRAFT_114884 [Agaricus bisporus var. burnettii JB137-S8]EKV48944.1 hypothetical protein AGABI2DRAFT_191110 [Agaricus bisporus var. bisporus H97]
MDYGILNRQYLSVIAGWPPEKIDQLLREIGTSTVFNDLGPTEMDIKILIKHFKDYFNAK